MGTSWTELQLANLVTKENGCKPLDPQGVFQVVFASVAMGWEWTLKASILSSTNYSSTKDGRKEWGSCSQ